MRAAVPSVRAALLFEGKARVLQCVRAVHDLRFGPRRFAARAAQPGDVVLAQSIGSLWRDGGAGSERALTLGKVQNLRVAARRLDGAFVPAGAVFSFWKQVGRATKRRGFVRGRELREGCLVPSVGGGLCQLSNALYDAALRAGFEIVERHAHTAVVPGSLAEVGRDATVFWNYVDLRFRVPCDVRIEATVGADSLTVRFSAAPSVAAAVRSANGAALRGAGVVVSGARAAPTGDCASCGVEQCFRHAERPREPVAVGRTAVLLDAYWPEYDAYLASVAGKHDVVFVPLDGRRRGTRRYRWGVSRFGSVREHALMTLLRSFQSRRLAQHGAERQRLLLAWARRLAARYGARLPYDVEHVVVMQHLLPALWAGGFLGGRTYDVLMTGMPMRALQRALDAAYALHPESPTLRDFRADAELLETEERALAGARIIVTPHAGIAATFGSRAVRLPWSMPAINDGASSAASGSPDGATVSDGVGRIVFPASTLGRAGAYEVRQAARELGLRVVLTGPDLEGAGFWDGVAVERCASFAAALRTRPVAAVLPAFVEHQPRRLLSAAAHGIPVVASDACGIDPGPGISVVPAGDVRALGAALGAAGRASAALRAR